MPTVQETIPGPLQPDVDAALAWFNERENVPFEVTGILDPEEALSEGAPRELRLVLCGGDRCEQRSFRVTRSAAGVEVAFAEGASAAEGETAPDPELDPPPGARRGWLDRALGQHAFVVLVFYRGFW